MLILPLLFQVGAAEIVRPVPADQSCAERRSGDLIGDMHCAPRLAYRMDGLDVGGPLLPRSDAERAFELALRQSRPQR